MDDDAFWSQRAHMEPPDVDQVRIERSGRILWNGQPVGEAELDRYLKLLPHLAPQPYTALDFQAGTPCRTIAKVRALMADRLSCAGNGRCLQGDYRAHVRRIGADYRQPGTNGSGSD